MISQVTLTSAQYDIIWHDLKLGEQPYPIAVRSQGKTMEERALIRNRVYGELTARRLAAGPRVEPDLRNALMLLATAPVSVDAIWLPERDAPKMRNALVVAAGDHGLLAELTDDGLTLRAIRGSAMVPAILALLPPANAAPGRSITVPTEALVPAGAAGPEPEPDEAGGSIYEKSRASSGISQQVRSLESLFVKPRLRGGQFVANVLDRHGKRTRSRPLEWFDTEDGRCMAQTGAGVDGRQHLLVAPADNTRIAGRIRDMLEALGATP